MSRLVLVAAMLVGCINNSTSSPQPDAAACASLVGTWSIAGACGTDICVVTQTGCATHLACSAGAASYTGSVTGASFAYSGTTANGTPATCNGTINANAISGSCQVTGAPTCAFTGTR